MPGISIGGGVGSGIYEHQVTYSNSSSVCYRARICGTSKLDNNLTAHESETIDAKCTACQGSVCDNSQFYWESVVLEKNNVAGYRRGIGSKRRDG